ncbi:MAG: acetyl-CoA carboxylase biotin carboxylase subunit, partial [Persicimonas sp.]
MNTRLQVEHPITELITGLDLVRWQVRIADGEELPFEQEDLTRSGAAIECRVYAEDPENNFMPAPGPITYMDGPDGPGVREDAGVYSGGEVPVHYDPMISKLCVWAEDRQAAIERMRRALAEYTISGIITNIAFHEEVLEHPDFVDGTYDTEFVPELMTDRQKPEPKYGDIAELAAVLAAHRRDEEIAEAGGESSQADRRGEKAGSRWKQYGRFAALRRF